MEFSDLTTNITQQNLQKQFLKDMIQTGVSINSNIEIRTYNNKIKSLSSQVWYKFNSTQIPRSLILQTIDLITADPTATESTLFSVHAIIQAIESVYTFDSTNNADNKIILITNSVGSDVSSLSEDNPCESGLILEILFELGMYQV